MRSARILFIGETLADGAITSPNWVAFCDCVAEWIDQILVFCGTDAAIPPLIESGGIVPVPEEFPDPDASLQGYRFDVSGASARAVLSALRFDPDRLVSHLFMFSHERLVAELEVDDGSNFIVLQLSEAQEEALLARMTSIEDNIQICERWGGVISNLIQRGEPWLPLGQRE